MPDAAMDLPVVDLAPYIEISANNNGGDLTVEVRELCSQVSRSLRETGALLVKDPRCSTEDNDRFLDMMERYFEKSDEFKRKQERPELHYQVGVTPEGVEVPRSLIDAFLQEKIRMMPPDSQPSIPTTKDPKWRYMWRVGPRPKNTRFKELNAEPVIPEGFPEWKETMDSWGSKMISAIEVAAEMAAIGFNLPKDSFTSLMKQLGGKARRDEMTGGGRRWLGRREGPWLGAAEGRAGLGGGTGEPAAVKVCPLQGPHLLGPTGSNLQRHGFEGTVFAGYHYDLNFLTIHGRSRFPGLNIWLKNGHKVEVKVPVGCLLIQSGKQLEWLTGGECLAGMHEVVVTNRTLSAIEIARQQNRSLWRVSSTLFAHIASDVVLKPLGHFAEAPDASRYPSLYAGDYVEQELSAINLKGSKTVLLG
ncbi:hypothetical protein MA16_Dca004274 [Dendrobium catenatum]|uniref:Isopenicillin N synthase-like Fe(2+) 2OG dioxygenase domain-containing protein n=1 Tax=Dendrobium catenatum TaxID=906689 RepID=A0A2I0W6Z5_9ASPA|nr:hypothetical protein MA16_Dca004274 [Dendrobium catenatum]